MTAFGPNSRAVASPRTIRLGVVCGLFTCCAYPLLIFAHPRKLPATILAAFIGPALGVACLGLRQLLDLDARRASSALGAFLNFAAGVLFSAMLLVQLAVDVTAAGQEISQQVAAIWLGLDVAWDTYIGLGTLCFSLAMRRHPRFGPGFSYTGLAIATALLALNLYTFPIPPGAAGLMDVGPLVGLWYLAVTLQMWRSLSWAGERVPSGPEHEHT